jgi:hypothetical protein
MSQEERFMAFDLLERLCRCIRRLCPDGGSPPGVGLRPPSRATSMPSQAHFAVYLKDVRGIPYDNAELARLSPEALFGPEIAKKLSAIPGYRGLKLRTAFHGNLDEIRASIRRAQANAERVGLKRYVALKIEQHFVIPFPKDLRVAVDVLAVLKEWAASRQGFVRVVEPVRRAEPSNRYLDPATLGTGVLAARTSGPGNTPDSPLPAPLAGAGQFVVVIERGWCPRPGVTPLVLATVPNAVEAVDEGPVLHAVATASIILGGHRVAEIEGIAPDVSFYKALCIAQDQAEQLDVVAAAVRGADLWLQAHGSQGRGVILLEEQDGALMPAESNADVHNAIQTAVANGHVVIEPAGTQLEPVVVDPGGLNPASIDTMIGQHFVADGATPPNLTLQSAAMDPRQTWPRSGAVVVAGGVPEGLLARHREPLSNFGELVDAWAWGTDIRCEGVLRQHVQEVMTWVLDSQPYVFGGSSGAAAIVAGVVVLMQQLRSRAVPPLLPLTSLQVRELFQLHGTTGLVELKDKRMPDLVAMLAAVQDGLKFPSVEIVPAPPAPPAATDPVPGPS